MEINIVYDNCNGYDCLDCLDVCPMDIFDWVDGRLVFDDSKCVGCRACLDVCDYDAIIILY